MGGRSVAVEQRIIIAMDKGSGKLIRLKVLGRGGQRTDPKAGSKPDSAGDSGEKRDLIFLIRVGLTRSQPQETPLGRGVQVIATVMRATSRRLLCGCRAEN